MISNMIELNILISNIILLKQAIEDGQIMLELDIYRKSISRYIHKSIKFKTIY